MVTVTGDAGRTLTVATDRGPRCSRTPRPACADYVVTAGS
jgi:hypothetical protein